MPGLESTLVVDIKPGVEPIYPDFSIDEQKAAEFATAPDGPIHLAPDGPGVSIVTDAKPRKILGGAVFDTSTRLGRLENRLVNGSDDTVIRVGVRRAHRVKTPEQIEAIIKHELTHIRQIRDGDPRVRVGKAVIGMTTWLGGVAGPTIEAITQKDLNLLLVAASGLYGAIAGYGVGCRLAPHEREARRIERETPYQGIVTGTRDPSFESLHEKVQRKQQESQSRVKSLFWGALDKVTSL